MADKIEVYRNDIRKKIGIKVLTESLAIFKEYGIFAEPEEIFTIWFGVSKSLIEMLLTNIHDININKFKTVRSKIISQIEKLKSLIGQIETPTKDMYG